MTLDVGYGLDRLSLADHAQVGQFLHVRGSLQDRIDVPGRVCNFTGGGSPHIELLCLLLRREHAGSAGHVAQLLVQVLGHLCV